MDNSQFPVARKTGLVVQEVPDEVLVYDLEQNKAHCLNRTAALVWRSCDGKNSVSDIAGLVALEMGSAVNDDFVWLALDQLTESGLLDNDIKPFFGQGRRDAIKKIGMASMVALPVIASLVAPSSAMAIHRRFDRVVIRPESYWASIWQWRLKPDQMLPRDRTS